MEAVMDRQLSLEFARITEQAALKSAPFADLTKAPCYFYH